MHQNILAVLYYLSGLFAACTMFFASELYVKSLGAMLSFYILYVIYEQIYE